MNKAMAHNIFRKLWRLGLVLTAILGVNHLSAAAPAQVPRYLFIFETSPVLKKNLPEIRGTLDKLFASNLQNQLVPNDDVAVWTVDEKLHTGSFQLESWSPDDAEMYSQQLKDFLRHQKFTRHASLAAIQPLLQRIVKESDQLTVLIFCDTESHLVGTPYDNGVNNTIAQMAAQLNGRQDPLILVLRSYHGEYLGCSVNHSATLEFPNFPPPPKPAPPKPVVKPVPPPVAPPVSGPAVTPVPAIVIVGTTAGTNVNQVMEMVHTSTPPATVTPPPAANPPATKSPATNAAVEKAVSPAETEEKPTPTPAAEPRVAVTTTPPTNSPVILAPEPTAASVTQTASAPKTTKTIVIASTAAANLTNPTNLAASAPPKTVVLATPAATSDANSRWPLFVGCGAALAATAIVVLLRVRARRPHGSLITSSMLNDPHQPPRK